MSPETFYTIVAILYFGIAIGFFAIAGMGIKSLWEDRKRK